MDVLSSIVYGTGYFSMRLNSVLDLQLLQWEFRHLVHIQTRSCRHYHVNNPEPVEDMYCCLKPENKSLIYPRLTRQTWCSLISSEANAERQQNLLAKEGRGFVISL